MERTFWTDALLTVVTLGFYIPYWLWERNQKLRSGHPGLELADNGWWILGGLILTFAGAYVAFLEPFWATAIQFVAILVFSYGVFTLGRNGEAVADAEGIDWSVPAPFLAGLFAGAFLAVQAGNIIPSLLIRVPAMLLVLSLPFLFYKVWDDLDLLIPIVMPPEPAAPS